MSRASSIPDSTRTGIESVREIAWASAAPAAWLRDRRIDIDTQIDAIEELMSEAELAPRIEAALAR